LILKVSNHDLAGGLLDDYISDLEIVEGSIEVLHTGPTKGQPFSVTFPRLREVCKRKDIGGNVAVINNPWIEILSMERLEKVSGVMIIGRDDWERRASEGNPRLKIIALPALTSIGMDLKVTDNAALQSLSIPSLTSV